jgi:hypothetical protein
VRLNLEPAFFARPVLIQVSNHRTEGKRCMQLYSPHIPEARGRVMPT